MDSVTNAHTTIQVHHSQYWICEWDVVPDFTNITYKDFNGLVNAQGYFAIVMTGTEFGNVSLSVQVRADEPPLELSDWSEVVDVSLIFEEESGVVFGPNGNDTQELPRLPSGACRIRVHARGRDRGYAATSVGGAPVEEHLIIAWPAPEAPEVQHKLVDNYGVSIRAR